MVVVRFVSFHDIQNGFTSSTTIMLHCNSDSGEAKKPGWRLGRTPGGSSALPNQVGG